MLQKNQLKMLIIKCHFDSAKCFLTNYNYIWCVTMIPIKFYKLKVNNVKEVNPSILKDEFSSGTDPSILTSIVPVLLDQSNKTS